MALLGGRNNARLKYRRVTIGPLKRRISRTTYLPFARYLYIKIWRVVYYGTSKCNIPIRGAKHIRYATNVRFVLPYTYIHALVCTIYVDTGYYSIWCRRKNMHLAEKVEA